jgi:hypothetical protein
MGYRKEFRVNPDSKVKLSKVDPSYKGKHESEEDAKQEIEASCQKLFHQQAELKLVFPPPSVDLADIRRKYHIAVKEEKANRNKG